MTSEDKFCSLGMLAEVASATLENDPDFNAANHQFKQICCNKIINNTSPRKSNGSEILTLDQIKLLSEKMLLEMFSELNCDEIRKNYSFKCFLMPDICSQIFKSFGNETRARCKMKAHLLSHVHELVAEANGKSGNDKFTAEPLYARKKRLKELSPKISRKKKKAKQHLKKKKDFFWDIIPTKIEVENSAKYRLSHNYDIARNSLAVEKCSSSILHNQHADTTPDGFVFAPVFPTEEVFLQQLSVSNHLVRRTSDFSSVSSGVRKKLHVIHKKKHKKKSDLSHPNCVVQWNVDFDSNESFEESCYLNCDVNSAEESVTPSHHDHSYTSVRGKTYDCDFYPTSENNKISKRSKKSHKCSGKKHQIIIPTPPFPYVYVPLLPHIAEIAEVGNESICNKCGHTFDGGLHENKSCTSNDSSFSPSIDQQSCYDFNKLLITDENDPETEDENALSDSYIEEMVSEDGLASEICDSKLSLCFEDLKPDCPQNLQAVEKKLALKFIRALRTKKKEERGPLTCQICKNKSFTAQATLMYHYRSHAGIKPFSCSVCEATFTRQHSLNYHMLIHNNKSRFMCGDCGRNFRHPSHYKEHLRRHTGETPYECTDCDLRFKTRNTYKRHLKTRHGKILTAQGIRLLSIEEFYKVRTSPRKKTSKSPEINHKDQEAHSPENIFPQQDLSDSENEMW